MSSPATIHREFADAWNRRDWNTFRNLLHPHYSYTGGDGKEMTGGPDIGLGIAQMYASAFPMPRSRSARFTCRATRPSPRWSRAARTKAT